MSAPLWGPPSMIASDVDGTLLADDENIARRTRDVLVRAAQAGVDLVLATGRPPRWIPQVTGQLAGTPAAVRYAVCANGAIVYDVENDRIVQTWALQPDQLRAVTEIVRAELPGAGLAAERAGAARDVTADAATAPFVATAGYQHAWLNPDHVEVSDAHLYVAPAVKLLARQPGTTSRAMADRVAPHLGDLAEVTFSIDTGLIEFSVPGVHKARGLQWLADNTGVDASSVIAFGDMPNDVEMLTWAAHGVAMGHGDAAALAAADEIAEPNYDDGLAKVLERWF